MQTPLMENLPDPIRAALAPFHPAGGVHWPKPVERFTFALADTDSADTMITVAYKGNHLCSVVFFEDCARSVFAPHPLPHGITQRHDYWAGLRQEIQKAMEDYATVRDLMEAAK